MNLMKMKRVSGVLNNNPGTFDNYLLKSSYGMIIYTFFTRLTRLSVHIKAKRTIMKSITNQASFLACDENITSSDSVTLKCSIYDRSLIF